MPAPSPKDDSTATSKPDFAWTAMMCLCRRCARHADAMELEHLAYVSEALADVWNEAFRIAAVHGSGHIGIEHLLHAMTGLSTSAGLLAAYGIDVEALRYEAAVVITGLAGASDRRAGDPVPDDDVLAALELSIEHARAAGFEDAAPDDLLLVLLRFEPGDAALARLVQLLHEHHRNGHRRVGSAAQPKPISMNRPPEPRTCDRADDSLAVLSSRLARLEQQAEDDRQRVVHATKELSRQRERLPDADDWRLQMQDLVTRVDALNETHRRSIAGPPQQAAAMPPAAAAGRQSSETAARERRDLDRQLAIMSRAMEDQQREVERLAGILARVVSSPRIPAAASPAAAGRSDATRQRAPRQARRRTRIARRLATLPRARVTRLGLARRPSRRERSWWRYLTDREAWRVARRRGGRCTSFDGRRGRKNSLLETSRPSQFAPTSEVRRERPAELPTKRFYLAIDDDIVDAPSIGPKTAERLRPARIFTVRELLAADPDEVAGLVTARHITADAVRNWQDQARLVITVPFLRGTHAQLLVGAGFRSAEAIIAADQASLMSAILRFATTREGQSVLRNGPPPELERIMTWKSNAADAEPARAA